MTKKIFFSELSTHINQKVELMGWISNKRGHGKITFLDLRDHTATIQAVGDKELAKIANESVILITALIKKRNERNINKKIVNGSIEAEVINFKVISEAKLPVFPIDTNGLEIDEELRLKYRYLDLRRERMLKNLTVRFETLQFIRNYLQENKFIEVETPILTKTTPEGARDFLVPSRLQRGNFYALPQSPQQYKQLLMVAGIERYFQIARCFRDEDPRRERAYGEFTQLDMEMSFVTQEDILGLTEDLFTKLIKKIFPQKEISQTPWPRLTHKEATTKYGSDRPDLRKDKNDKDELAFAWVLDFPLFTRQSKEDYFHGSGKAVFAPSHHMFTAPKEEDIPLLKTQPEKVRGLQHDLVLNGFEVGGGSIRIHKADIQNAVFDLIGFTEKQKQQFNHMLEAFSFGVPPHGGIAPGIDRLLFAILGEPSVREVIAFPTSSSGFTSVMNAPSKAENEQLQELGIRTVDEKNND
jgi:aspartyl-tRNA synthetase